MSYPKVQSTNYFEAANFDSLLNRLDRIQPTAERQWGQMTVGQMLHHLNLAIGSGLGYYQLPDNSNLISRSISKFLVLNVLKSFPKGTSTPQTLRVTEAFEVESEKKRLKEILTKAYLTQTDEDWAKHTYFGKMSRTDWGKLIMIHCHHHFQQFSN